MWVKQYVGAVPQHYACHSLAERLVQACTSSCGLLGKLVRVGLGVSMLLFLIACTLLCAPVVGL